MKRFVGILIALIAASFMACCAYAAESEFEVVTGDVTFEDGQPVFHVQYTAPHMDNDYYGIGIHINKYGSSGHGQGIPANAASNAEMQFSGEGFDFIPGKEYSYYATLKIDSTGETYYGDTKTFTMPGNCENISGDQNIDLGSNESEQKKFIWFKYTATNGGQATFQLHGNQSILAIIRGKDDARLEEGRTDNGTASFTREFSVGQEVYLLCKIGPNNSSNCYLNISINEHPAKELVISSNGGIWDDQEGEIKTEHLYREYHVGGWEDAPINLDEYSKIIQNPNYILIGWNTAADGSGKQYSCFDSIDFDAIEDGNTVYAQWMSCGDPPCVIFNTNGGSFNEDNASDGTSEILANSDEEVIAPNVYRTGYTFIGWSDRTSHNNTKYFYFPGETIDNADDGELILYALWISNSSRSRVLIYDTNAPGVFFYHKNYSREIDYNPTVVFGSTHYDVERRGYILTGWNTKRDGTGTHYEVGHEINVNEEFREQYVTVLYAEWEAVDLPEKYYVFITHDGEFENGTKYQVVDRSTSNDVPVPKQEGHQFIGWHNQPGNGWSIGDYYVFYELQEAAPDKNLYLYPMWINNKSPKRSLIISYNGGVLDEKTFTDASYLDAPSDGGCILEWYFRDEEVRPVHNFIKDVSKSVYRNGYTFAGWNTKSDGSGEQYSENEMSIWTDDEYKYILYAQWVKNEEPTRPTTSTGSSSSHVSTSTTTTTKNPDGSTTTTVTNKATGTVTETTKAKDGSTTTVETKKDGTVTETVKTQEGTTGTVVTDKSGDVTEVKSTISTTAVKESDKTGEAVTIPVEVPAASSTQDAPTIEITIPKSTDSVTVEIPVKKTSPGLVAVIVDEDGNETIVPKSVVTENGVKMELDGSSNIKIVDNGKDFNDIPEGHWAEDAVAFASARELFNGIDETTFAPNRPVTRGMLAAVLYRLESEPESNVAEVFTDVQDNAYYTDGVSWASESGIVTGYGDGTYKPDQIISRQQLAAMLYRYAGSPASNYALAYPDADNVSDYAVDAMRWAVENGIITGTTNGTLNPHGIATRAQVAIMLMRYCETMA